MQVNESAPHSVGGGSPSPAPRPPLRWWPAVVILGLTIAVITLIRLQEDEPFQTRNLASLVVALVTGAMLWLWWLLGSRAPWRWRVIGCGGALMVVGLGLALFRVVGVSGDLMPILEPRWVTRQKPAPEAPDTAAPPAASGVTHAPRRIVADFPQFLGPHRNCVIEGIELDADWQARPPELLWRRPIGEGWSGFAVVGERAFTQDQQGPWERVLCLELATGRLLWEHRDSTRYETTIAGAGPRAVPTVHKDRVLTLGATGLLNCLDASSGRLLWQRWITRDADSSIPEWGFAGSPLVWDGKVIVSAGGGSGRSLWAYDLETGAPVWHAGDDAAGYSAPCLLELAGALQILIFNRHRITAHEAQTGRVLWEHPWGTGHPHVALPVRTGPARFALSSGYGVGLGLFEVQRGDEGSWQVHELWHTRSLKAKFANFIHRDGFLYGLDDGILACVELADGSRRWKRGRYGHGQMLQVGGLVLLTAEMGDLLLLRLDPKGPDELGRFPVFNRKSWNPPALAGDYLLWRNDREAVCLRLTVRPASTHPRGGDSPPEVP